jgi:hypothetical protein
MILFQQQGSIFCRVPDDLAKPY